MSDHSEHISTSSSDRFLKTIQSTYTCTSSTQQSTVYHNDMHNKAAIKYVV